MNNMIEFRIYGINNVELVEPRNIIIPIARIYEVDSSDLSILVDRGGVPTRYLIDDECIDQVINLLVNDLNL